MVVLSYNSFAQIIQNGDFENNSVSPWYIDPRDNGRIELTQEDSKIGKTSVVVPLVKGSSLVYENVLFEKNATYEISLWSKIKDGNCGNCEIVVEYRSGGKEIIDYQTNLNNYEWRKVSGKYTHMADEPARLLVNFPAGGTLLIDDIKVNKLDNRGIATYQIGRNIIPEGDFESPKDIDRWQINPASAGVKPQIVTNEAILGNGSAFLGGRSLNKYLLQYNSIDFQPNKKYRFTAYIKLAEGGTGSGDISYWTDKRNSVVETVALSDKKWTKLQGDAKIASAEAIHLQIGVDSYSDFYLDGVSIYELSDEQLKNEVKIKRNSKFADIENHWGKNIIIKSFENSFIDGVNDNEFKPNEEVKFDEFTKMLLSFLDFSPKVNENNWRDIYLSESLARDIISEKDLENAQKPISRMKVATMIEKVLNEPYHSDLSIYTDYIKDIATYSQEQKNTIIKLVSKGIMVGDIEGNFSGNNSITRAEAVVVCQRIINPSYRYIENIKSDKDSEHWQSMWESPLALHNDTHGYLFGKDKTDEELYNMVKDLNVDYVNISAYGEDGGYFTYPSKLVPEMNNPNADGFDQLAKWKRVLEKAGKKFFVYFNRWGEEQAVVHPEWKRINSKGENVTAFGKMIIPCIYPSKNGDGFLERVMGQSLGEIQKKYNPLGYWLDGGARAENCYCESCKYFYTLYTGRTEIPFSPNDEGFSEYSAIQLLRYDQHIKYLTGIIHSVNPTATIGVNGGFLYNYGDKWIDFRGVPDGITVDYDTRDISTGPVMQSTRVLSQMYGVDKEVTSQIMHCILPNKDRNSDEFASTKINMISGALSISRGAGWQLWSGGASFIKVPEMRETIGYLVDYFKKRKGGYGKSISANKVATVLSEEDLMYGQFNNILNYSEYQYAQALAMAIHDCGYGVDVLNINFLMKQAEDYDVILIFNQKKFTEEALIKIEELQKMGKTIIFLGSALNCDESNKIFERLTGIKRGNFIPKKSSVKTDDYYAKFDNAYSIDIQNANIISSMNFEDGTTLPFITKNENVYYVNLNTIKIEDSAKIAKYIMYEAGLGPNVAAEGKDGQRYLLYNFRERLNEDDITLHITDITAEKKGKEISPYLTNNFDNNFEMLSDLNLKVALKSEPKSVKIYPEDANCSYTYYNGILEVKISGFTTYAILEIDGIKLKDITFLPRDYSKTHNFGFRESLDKYFDLDFKQVLQVGDVANFELNAAQNEGFASQTELIQKQLSKYSVSITSSDNSVFEMGSNNKGIAKAPGVAHIKVEISDGKNKSEKKYTVNVVSDTINNPKYSTIELKDESKWAGEIKFYDEKTIVDNGIATNSTKLGDAVVELNMGYVFKGGDWPTIAVRVQDNNLSLLKGGSCYAFVIKSDKVELHKFINGVRIPLIGDFGPTFAEFGNAKNEYFISGEQNKVKIGTVNEDNGVRIFVEINGNMVFDIVDTKNPIKNSGFVNIYGNSGAITLK